MSSRRRKIKRPFAWFAALSFNLLLMVFVTLTVHLINENREAIGEEYVTSSEAVSATRDRMGEMFADLIPEGKDPRAFWSGEINRLLREDNLTSARGLLLAAPNMLSRKDAAAVLAAAETERVGTLDERLLAAATLFLPDDVRARYERATAPSLVETLTNTDDTDADETDPSTISDETIEENAPSVQLDEGPAEAETNSAFFVLGSERDLAYQSAGWLRGDRTDVFSLSISGLGLAAQNHRFEKIELTENALRGASLVKAARRAGRLQPSFSQALESRLNAALPPNKLKAELQSAYGQGGSILIQGDAILDAFARATDQNKLAPFLAQLERISRLQENKPNSAAMTLLEIVSNQRDMKRAELIAFAGGDRAVALAEFYGPDALNAAQTVMNWTLRLIVLIMSVVVVSLVLVWLGFATLMRSFRQSDSLGNHYGY